MPELGKTLSQARVARGLTLEDCERDTRISKRYLDALEREDWRIFPAPVYSRAFLRTYAQYLGLNPADLMRLYQQQTEEAPVVKPLPEIPAAPATGSINWALAAGVAVLVLIAGAFLFISSRGGGGGDDGTTVTVPTQTLPTVDPEAQGGGVPPAVGRPVGEVEEGVVPDLRDVRVTDAVNALRQAGIQYVIVEQDAAGTPGVVSSQNPEPGSDANGDTSVTLIVPVQ